MTDEAIIAEELNLEEVDTDEEDDSEDVDTEKEDLKAQLEKERAEREKRENRYKSSKKKESQVQPKKEVVVNDNIDIDARIEQKFNMIQEQNDFIKAYWDEVFTEVQKIKSKHPTLTLEQAYKLSPVSTDQPSKEVPESLSMWWRANPNAYNNSKVITLEQLVALDKTAYRNAKEKITKWELTLKN